MPDEPVAVIVLAGEREPGPLAQAAGVPARALVPIAGRPMLRWVLEALQAAQTAGPVCVVGPPSLRPAVGSAEFLEQGNSLVENLHRGAAHFSAHPRVLVVTADVPLLTPDAVDDFVRQACESGADVCYAIVSKACCLACFPEIKRTYVRLRDGVFTGGNLFTLRTAAAPAVERLLDRAFAARKKPLQLARLTGPAVLARFVLRQLSIACAEQRVGNLLGCSARAIISPYAEVGADVDKADDLAAVQRRMEERPAAR